MMDGSRAMVPLELVHTAYTVPPQPYDGIFAASTTGLAASFVETDAITHGILRMRRTGCNRPREPHPWLLPTQPHRSEDD